MAREILEMTVASVTQELLDVKTIRLKWPDGYSPDFKTGQFITLQWPDTPAYRRAYSLSSCALDRGHYDVTVKRDGKMGTRLVDWAKHGDKLMVHPPAGRFLPQLEPGKHLICLAGGSGVTPFLGFVREATLRRLTTRILVLYSVRTPRDIIFNDRFRQLEQDNPYFSFHVTCTRLHDEEKWDGRRGRITADWVKSYVLDLPNTVFYACGPHALVDFAEQIVLKDLQVPKEQMVAEKWG